MAISVELVDKYTRTFIDFWRFRPRRFFPALAGSPERYLTAPQFLFSSLGLVLAMLGAAFALVQAPVERVGTAPAEALALRIVVFLVATLLLNSLCFRAISQIWPIKGRASFGSIFELQCFMMAIFTPMAAVDLLVGPIVAELIAKDILPAWSVFFQIGVGAMVGLAGLFFWQMPGMAFVNGVSTSRIWFGLLLWSAMLGVIGGIAAIVIVG